MLSFVKKKIKLDSVLSGVAGEYLCAGELSRRGYIASITLRNSKGVDILVTNAAATKTVAIQVKTRYSRGTKWVMNEKAEKHYAPNFFYVFVNLNFGDPAEFFIVPSRVVAETIRKHHLNWLKTPGLKGQAHRPTSMRTFCDDEKRYLNRWDVIGLQSDCKFIK